MSFCWATVMVFDMEESLKFYQEIVGLAVDRRFMAGPEREIAFLGSGETKIELICDKSAEKAQIGESVSLGFTVDSIETKMEVLKNKNVLVHSGPFQPNPHVRFFYVKDPNGLKIQFVENI